MQSTARESIAKIQAELIRALVHGTPVPAGFDEPRVRSVARSLINKRRQALARSWPTLVQRISDKYVEQFTEYGKSHPLPASANSLADGRAFLAWLAAKEPPTDALRIEALAYDMRWRETPLGLCRRSGFGLKVARLPQSGKWLLGLRLPWSGERWWGLPTTIK